MIFQKPVKELDVIDSTPSSAAIRDERMVFAILSVLGLPLILLLGVGMWTLGSKAILYRQVDSWPQVSGTLLKAETEPILKKRSLHHEVRLTYVYTVGTLCYTNQTVSPEPISFGTAEAAIGFIQSLMPPDWAFQWQPRSMALGTGYLLDSAPCPLRIRHSPEYPQSSILTTDPGQSQTFLNGILAIICGSFAILGLAAWLFLAAICLRSVLRKFSIAPMASREECLHVLSLVGEAREKGRQWTAIHGEHGMISTILSRLDRLYQECIDGRLRARPHDHYGFTRGIEEQCLMPEQDEVSNAFHHSLNRLEEYLTNSTGPQQPGKIPKEPMD